MEQIEYACIFGNMYKLDMPGIKECSWLFCINCKFL